MYERREGEGRIRIIRSRGDLERHLAAWESDRVVAAAVLMEGADPIARVEDLDEWGRRGVRIVGPAWGRTRYSGGSGAPGGLTRQDRELVAAMRERGVVLDASHLAEEAFWDALEIGRMRSRLALERPGAHAGRPAHGEPTNDSPRSF